MDIKLSGSSQARASSVGIAQAASFIARTQRHDGEIPWCEGQKTDPWDHVESAMGLSVGGYLGESRRAF
ncbi:MAG: phenyltransferase domain-containing protein, partial [Desulfobacterales bacterium]